MYFAVALGFCVLISRPSPLPSHLKFRFLYGFYFYDKNLKDKHKYFDDFGESCLLILRFFSYFFNIVLQSLHNFKNLNSDLITTDLIVSF